MSPAPAADLQASRYGRAPAKLGRRTRWWLIGSALVAAIALTAWWAFSPQSTPATPQVIRYTAEDAAHLRVLVELTPDSSRDAVCSVVARSSFQADVGYVELEVSAQERPEPQRHEVVIRTVQPPTAAVVGECWFSE